MCILHGTVHSACKPSLSYAILHAAALPGGQRSSTLLYMQATINMNRLQYKSLLKHKYEQYVFPFMSLKDLACQVL